MGRTDSRGKFARWQKKRFLIEVGFTPKKKNTPPRAAQPVFYLRSILHGAVSPPPPYNSRSSASTTAPPLLPAIVVLCLCRRLFVDCHFLLLLSAPLLPLRHQPSAASLQPPSSSKQSLLQLNHRAPPLAIRRCYPSLPPHTC
jgi:hypothetical protein